MQEENTGRRVNTGHSAPLWLARCTSHVTGWPTLYCIRKITSTYGGDFYIDYPKTKWDDITNFISIEMEGTLHLKGVVVLPNTILKRLVGAPPTSRGRVTRIKSRASSWRSHRSHGRFYNWSHTPWGDPTELDMPDW